MTSEMDENKLEKDVALIETSIFDQGGTQYCSNCQINLREYVSNYFSLDSDERAKTGLVPQENLSLFLQKNKMQCPWCRKYLIHSKPSIDMGGSDF